MELITNILIEYLKHNKRIVVPKLGTFIVKQPSGNIIFSDLMRGDDGVLRSLLVAYGMKEMEANGLIDRFVFDVHHAINRGERFTIENLGDFVGGDNNNIIFKHKREPLVIGGNIKPPVEVLNAEKLKLQRSNDLRLSDRTGVRNSKTEQRKRLSQSRRGHDEDSEILTLGKPDDYLRGLKYDKNKNKKRNEERSESKGPKLPSMFVILLIAIISIIAVWAGWLWLNTGSVGISLTKDKSLVIDRDTTNNAIEQDTILIDTLTGADINIEATDATDNISADETDTTVTR